MYRINWLCKHLEKVKNCQASIYGKGQKQNSFTELSKTVFPYEHCYDFSQPVNSFLNSWLSTHWITPNIMAHIWQKSYKYL